MRGGRTRTNWSSRARTALLAAAVVALLLAAVVPQASATRIVRIGSRVTISPRHGFHGRVKSSNQGCIAERTVVLMLQVGSAKPTFLRKGKSNLSGRWKISVTGVGGPAPLKVFARLKPSSQGAAGTIYKCSGSRSRKIEIGS